MKHLKEEFDKLTFKEVIIFCLAAVSLAAGFVLLFLGMFIQPEGEIHESVLTAFGIILVFVGSVVGVDLKYAASTNKFKADVSRYVAEALAKKGE